MPRVRSPQGYEKLSPEDFRDDVMGLLGPVGMVRAGGHGMKQIGERLSSVAGLRSAMEGIPVRRLSEYLDEFLRAFRRVSKRGSEAAPSAYTSDVLRPFEREVVTRKNATSPFAELGKAVVTNRHGFDLTDVPETYGEYRFLQELLSSGYMHP